MNYLKFGSSKNFIVFLHGWGADINSFIWLKDYFENDYSLVFINFFDENYPTKPYFVADYVNDLKSILDKFDIENLLLVGHSFGGRVAIKFSFYFQNFYNNYLLCLIDSAGLLPKRNIVYKYRIHRYKKLKKLAEQNLKYKNKLLLCGSNDYKKLSPLMKNTFVNVVNEDLSNCAKFIKCRTLIVWGKKDKDTKLYMAKKLNRLIKNSSLKIYNAGHFSFLEKKEDFIIILDSFVKNL